MMLKSIISAGMAVMMMACTLSQASQASGNGEFNVSGDFTAIEVGGAYAVTCTQDAAKAGTVLISGPENIVNNTQVKVKNNTLKIGTKNNIFTNSSNKPVKATVYYKNSITEVDLAGAADLEISSLGTPASKTEIECAGAASVTVGTVKGSKIDIEMAGASRANIKQASANKIEVEVAGASSVKLANIEASTLELEAAGASSISASGNAVNLVAEAAGASSINISKLNRQNLRTSIDISSSLKE